MNTVVENIPGDMNRSPIKILVVEDNPINQQLLQATLKQAGHAVIAANSGEQALELFLAEKPDAVLMDVILPGISGIEATRRIRALDSDDWVPIIFLSALTHRDDMVRGLEAGGDDYLVKPVDLVLLLAKIAAMQRIAALKTKLRAANQELGLQEILLGSLGEGVYGVNKQGICTFINGAALDMLGFESSEVLGQNQHRLFHHHFPDGRPFPYDECPIHNTLSDGMSRSGEEWFFCKNGSGFPVRYTCNSIREGEDIQGAVVVFDDISEHKRTEEKLHLAASVFANAQEGIIITDTAGVIIDVNPAFTKITGYQHVEAIGRNPKMLASGRHGPEFYDALWQTLRTDGYWRGEIWNRNKSGEIYPESLSISAVYASDQRVKHYVGVFSDITHVKEHEQRLDLIAHHDALTGLPNRRLLMDRLRQAIAQTQRDGSVLAVCYLDLDGFKPVNDKFGHDAGDLVLKEMARRFEACLRVGDTVSRLGGDEFVFLLLGLNGIEACKALLERIQGAATAPICINDQEEVSLSASIGVALSPRDGDEQEILLQQADKAMYEAKLRGKNRYEV